MKYVLDTNIVLIYLKNNTTKDHIEQVFSPFKSSNIPIVSVVTLGEIESIALRNNWGEKRIGAVLKFLDKCVIADINSKDIIKKYGEIDAFSQGKLKFNPLGNSSRNMGKSDLWIAALASLVDAQLLTTDKDFSHLDKTYLNLNLIELMK